MIINDILCIESDMFIKWHKKPPNVIFLNLFVTFLLFYDILYFVTFYTKYDIFMRTNDILCTKRDIF